MFDGLFAQLRINIETVKSVVSMHEHARTLFYGPAGNAEDEWAPVRNTAIGKFAWQTYDHCAALTRLYAVYAVFVEDLASEYVRMLPALYSQYGELPEAVLKQHRIGFGQILLKLGTDGPYRHLLEANIISSLSHGLAGGTPYSLLNEAFFVDRQNYRPDALGRLFGYLGIEDVSRRMGAHPGIRDFLLENVDQEATFDGELNRFVQLRNEAAHAQVDELISSDEFRRLADFVYLACGILREIVWRQVLDRKLALGECPEIGVVVHVYHHGTTAIVRTRVCAVAVGESVLVVQNSRCRLASVLSIQREGIPLESIQTREDEEVGFGIDQICHEGSTFRALPGHLAMSIQEELFDADDIADTAGVDYSGNDTGGESLEAALGDISASIDSDSTDA